MAQLINVRLNKGDAGSLGFRLQGGKDFGTPLMVQKVNVGSPAEKAGLLAGDSVVKINTTDVFNLRHKDAQDVIIRAGPSFELTIQRGGSTWKPSVTPLPKAAISNNYSSPVTKTSLAAKPQASIGSIGTGHNLSAKPFSPQLNGAVNGGPKLVNKQYNSPVGLYSEESIAETLSAQTEVLSTGVLGVNFKKNEKNYDASNSAVFRMVQEADKEPRDPESEPDSGVVSVPLVVGGLRHVQAPETKPAPTTPQLPPGQNICVECERLIVGVFVRIKDKNLHVECFKCATCGASLKNVGYYNINQKLYCDIHAKLAVRNNPPAPNLVPVTVPPGGKPPAGTISAALASHSLPSAPAPLSPLPSANTTALPFQHNNEIDNISNESICLALADISEQTETESVESEENSNDKVYVTEKIVPIGERDNLKCRGPLPFSTYMKVRSSSSFSSSRPFSSVSAPLSPSVNNYATLPKPAPAPPSFSSPVSAPSSAEHAQINHQPMINGKQDQITVNLLNDNNASASTPPICSPTLERKNVQMTTNGEANVQKNFQEKFHKEVVPEMLNVMPVSEEFGQKPNIMKISQTKPTLSKKPVVIENRNQNLVSKNFLPTSEVVSADCQSNLDPKPTAQVPNSEKKSLSPISLTFKIPKEAQINNAKINGSNDKKEHVLIHVSNLEQHNDIRAEENLEDKQAVLQNSNMHPKSLKINEEFEEKCNISQISQTKPIVSKKPSTEVAIGNCQSNVDPKHTTQATNSEKKPLGPISFTFKLPKDAQISNAKINGSNNTNEHVLISANRLEEHNGMKVHENLENKEGILQNSNIHLKSAKLTSNSMLKNGDLKTNRVNNTDDSSISNNKEIVCCVCETEIERGPFITALGKIWCPEHFICNTPSCKRPLQDLGFVEEQGQLYCEYCFEQYIAPPCNKCGGKVKGDCLKAIGKNFHPECFSCSYCGKLFGNSPFFLEDGQPYCDTDWNELFTTKCFACGFPVEAGDRWVEALNNNYHSQCFNCTMCKKNLEGQSFFAKGGRPFCKNHAR